jgi:hypothetical protein
MNIGKHIVRQAIRFLTVCILSTLEAAISWTSICFLTKIPIISQEFLLYIIPFLVIKSFWERESFEFFYVAEVVFISYNSPKYLAAFLFCSTCISLKSFSSIYYKKIFFFGNGMEDISKSTYREAISIGKLRLKLDPLIKKENNILIVNSFEDIHFLNDTIPEDSRQMITSWQDKRENLFCFQQDASESKNNTNKKILLICNNLSLIEEFIRNYPLAVLTILTCNIEVSSNVQKEVIYYVKGIQLPEYFDYVVDLFDIDTQNYLIYQSIVSSLHFSAEKYIFHHVKSPVIDIYIMNNVYKRVLLHAISRNKKWLFIEIECGFLEGSKDFEKELQRAFSEGIKMEKTCHFTSKSKFFIKLSSVINSNSSLLSIITTIDSQRVLKFFNRERSNKILFDYTTFYIQENQFIIYEDSTEGILEKNYSIEDKIIHKYFRTSQTIKE